MRILTWGKYNEGYRKDVGQQVSKMRLLLSLAYARRRPLGFGRSNRQCWRPLALYRRRLLAYRRRRKLLFLAILIDWRRPLDRRRPIERRRPLERSLDRRRPLERSLNKRRPLIDQYHLQFI